MIEGIILFIMSDELPRLLILANEVVLNEGYQPVGMSIALVLEVKPIMHLLDIEGSLMSVVS